MIQQYFLSIAYLILVSFLFLVDSYRRQISFAIRIKGALMENRKLLDAFFVSGIIISLLALFFPMHPGPVILGDLIPALWIFYSAFFFRFRYSEKRTEQGEAFFETFTQDRTTRLGWITALIAAVHFIIPQFVLL